MKTLKPFDFWHFWDQELSYQSQIISFQVKIPKFNKECPFTLITSMSHIKNFKKISREWWKIYKKDGVQDWAAPSSSSSPKLWPWTTDTQWRHNLKKSESLGQWGRQNLLRPYLKIWEWELIFSRAVKAISSSGVHGPWNNSPSSSRDIFDVFHTKF